MVDDNAAAREILSTLARSFGLEVDVAWDGRQALQLVAEADQKSLPYDLVLMDWKMPVMDGLEAVHQLQSEQLSQVPTVIMVTAYGREEAVSSAAMRGVKLNAVLSKPVTVATLLEAIGGALGKGVITETRAYEKTDSHSDVMDQVRGARVLLVEDNELNQELAMELLDNAGIEVVLARNGQESLDILDTDARFDGVLMDCQMPVMDGYTATRAIRKNPAFAQLPIIAMTASAMAGDREKVLEAGMWDHIVKPLNVNDMFTTIAKWIKPARSVLRPSGVPVTKAADTSTSSIASIASTAQRNGGTSAPDPALLQAALQRLTLLLRDGDLEATEVVETLQPLVAGTPMALAIKRVALAVSDCDFDAALAAIAEAGL